jgi:hypothetical protein
MYKEYTLNINMESTIRRIAFGKDDQHLFKSIRRKVSSRQDRGYMIQTFQKFTEGYLYYEGRKLIGITIWENVEGGPNKAANNPGKGPDYMNLCIYYNTTNMECVLSDLEEKCMVNQLEYIEYPLDNLKDYPLFFKYDYFLLYGHTDIYVIVKKYININIHNEKKINSINNVLFRYNVYDNNIMFRTIIETFHADVLETIAISSDTGNQENTF